MQGTVLNLVAAESDPARQTIAQIASQERPETLVKELSRIQHLSLPPHHPLTSQDSHPQRLEKIFLSTYERKPADFEALLGMPGVGPRTMRALNLLSELVSGVAPTSETPPATALPTGAKTAIPTRWTGRHMIGP